MAIPSYGPASPTASRAFLESLLLSRTSPTHGTGLIWAPIDKALLGGYVRPGTSAMKLPCLGGTGPETIEQNKRSPSLRTGSGRLKLSEEVLRIGSCAFTRNESICESAPGSGYVASKISLVSRLWAGCRAWTVKCRCHLVVKSPRLYLDALVAQRDNHLALSAAGVCSPSQLSPNRHTDHAGRLYSLLSP